MTDYADDYDTETEDPPVEPAAEKKNWRRELEEQAKAGKAAAKEAADAKRELNFLKAGVDTESAIGKMFAKGYDGDITADAIKAAWSEVSGTSAPVEVSEVPAEELAAHSRMTSAAAGGERSSEFDQALAAVTAPKWTDPGAAAATLAAFVAAGGSLTEDAPGGFLYGSAAG